MKLTLGVVLISVGMLLLAGWELYVVPLAYKPIAPGTYGEIYGPVSYFRPWADGLFIVLIAAGVVLLCLHWLRRKRTFIT